MNEKRWTEIEITTLLKKEEGMTLIEIIAAIAILSLVITGFLAFFINASRAGVRTERQSEANYYSQEILEQVMYIAEYSEDIEDYRNRISAEGWDVSSNPYVLQKEGFTTTLNIEQEEDRHGELMDNLYRLSIETYNGENSNSTRLSYFESSVELDVSNPPSIEEGEDS